MAQTASIATRRAVEILGLEQTLEKRLGELALEWGLEPGALRPKAVVAQNVAAEALEKSSGAKYPAVHVYCERVSNLLREKFRRFSGKAKLTLEARVSQDRLEGLDQALELYVDALTRVLEENRGDWGQGMFYTGGYEVTLQPAKQGGKNFLQTAKVSFEVEISQE